MNLSDHKKINGTDAIKLILDGGEVFDVHGAKYYIDQEHKTLWYASPFYRTELDRPFNHVLQNDWYIPKPFDVRQAMKENPNEWVGKFYSEERNAWVAVGFNSFVFRPVLAYYDNKDKFNPQDLKHYVLSESDLDCCVPLHEERP